MTPTAPSTCGPKIALLTPSLFDFLNWIQEAADAAS
jgi:hypothetical protein